MKCLSYPVGLEIHPQQVEKVLEILNTLRQDREVQVIAAVKSVLVSFGTKDRNKFENDLLVLALAEEEFIFHYSPNGSYCVVQRR